MVTWGSTIKKMPYLSILVATSNISLLDHWMRCANDLLQSISVGSTSHGRTDVNKPRYSLVERTGSIRQLVLRRATPFFSSLGFDPPLPLSVTKTMNSLRLWRSFGLLSLLMKDGVLENPPFGSLIFPLNASFYSGIFQPCFITRGYPKHSKTVMQYCMVKQGPPFPTEKNGE